MFLEHKARKLRSGPPVTEPCPKSNEPKPVQRERKPNGTTDVTDSTVSVRHLMLCLQMTNGLFWIPKLGALFRSIRLVRGITTALPIIMIVLRTLQMCKAVCLGVC